MDIFYSVAMFMGNCFTKIWTALGTWGVIGFGIIAVAVFRKISNLMKMIFEF